MSDKGDVTISGDAKECPALGGAPAKCSIRLERKQDAETYKTRHDRITGLDDNHAMRFARVRSARHDLGALPHRANVVRFLSLYCLVIS